MTISVLISNICLHKMNAGRSTINTIFMVTKIQKQRQRIYTKIIEEIYLYRKTYITTILIIDS